MTDIALRGRRWRRFDGQRIIRWAGAAIALLFLAYSVDFLDVRLERLLQMFGRLGILLQDRYYPPDFSYVLERSYLESVLDTVLMAYLGGLLGMAAAVPLAWLAAGNVTPNRLMSYPIAKLIIMASRAVHEMIWAILFVSILGFGMLAGTCAMTMFCIGFAGKLFAEEIEAIDMRPVEALRAAGATPLQTASFAVWPQVKVAWTGIAIYTWDVAFRAATVVGFFGAGGMGWHLKRNVQQLESQKVAAIILSIVALVVMAEIVSAWARSRVARRK